MPGKQKSRIRRPAVLLILLTTLLSWAGSAYAQSDPQMTQYWAMPSYYNPGAAGSTDYLRIRAGARLQWLGIENAPKSFLGAADSPLPFFGKKLGVGVNLTSESLGLFSNLLAGVQISYRMKLFKGEFRIGIQPAYYNSKFKGSEVFIPDGDDYHQPTDPNLPNQDLTGNAFDLGAGVWYSHKYFSVGVSGQHLLQPSVKLGVEGSEASDAQQQYETELSRMLYFTAIGNIPLKNTLFTLQPSLQAKTDFNMWTAEVTMRATYNKFLNFGLGYRWKDAISIMAGAEFKNFFLGYSYDYPLSKIAKASSGSHELILGYQLKLDFTGKNKNKHRSIRIM